MSSSIGVLHCEDASRANPKNAPQKYFIILTVAAGARQETLVK